MQGLEHLERSLVHDSGYLLGYLKQVKGDSDIPSAR